MMSVLFIDEYINNDKGDDNEEEEEDGEDLPSLVPVVDDDGDGDVLLSPFDSCFVLSLHSCCCCSEEWREYEDKRENLQRKSDGDKAVSGGED